ncbi:MAG: YebC/PmpR family DNA-binding transcriptional regulator [Gammaproteobacteria bacterium]|nr:YebC/PmpR family DNA-binding transcriptional regulator [Gammaproteobacteria bacterium]
MAGHSKWANIKFRKAAQDAKKGKLFTKLIREITVAARESGDDPDANPRLRAAMDKAFAANMQKDAVERAIKRGAGGGEGSNYEEVRYEGYAPGGIAILVECQTDNRNRTVGEVRHAFSKHGGNLGTDGSVSYLFETLGVIGFPPGSDETAIMETAADAGARDVVTDHEGYVEVTTEAPDFHRVKRALADAGLAPERADIVQRAHTEVPVGVDDGDQVLKLLDALEDLDDVKDVYSNADFPDALFAEAS